MIECKRITKYFFLNGFIDVCETETGDLYTLTRPNYVLFTRGEPDKLCLSLIPLAVFYCYPVSAKLSYKGKPITTSD